MKDLFKEILIFIGMILFLLFILCGLGTMMLCVLFGNIIGFIFIGIFCLLLGINIYIYYKEEIENGE